MKTVFIAIIFSTFLFNAQAESVYIDMAAEISQYQDTYKLTSETETELVYEVKKRRMKMNAVLVDGDGKISKDKSKSRRVPGKKKWDDGHNRITLKEGINGELLINLDAKECDKIKGAVVCFDQNIDLVAEFTQGDFASLKTGEETVIFELTQKSVDDFINDTAQMIHEQLSEQLKLGITRSFMFKMLLKIAGSSVDDVRVRTNLNSFDLKLAPISGNKKSFVFQYTGDLDLSVSLYF